MKKNRMMRLASGMLVLTLATTCAISGTFAKYTTSTNGEDSARVAKWGFTDTDSSIALDNLFANAYGTNGSATTTTDTGATVKSNTNVIAPGTAGSATFGFTYGGVSGVNAPEVAYTFKVSTDGSSCDQAIQDNTNIQWKLDDGAWGTWTELTTAIEALDGNKTDDKYAPGELPAAFNSTGANTHTVYWQWLFDEASSAEGTQAVASADDSDTTLTQDEIDTKMGNESTKLAEVTLKITVTATQVD